MIWDVLFTVNGVWGFNPDYLVGIKRLGLLLEICLMIMNMMEQRIGEYASSLLVDMLKYLEW